MSKFELSPVTKEFQNQIETHLDHVNDKVLVGVSGGPDSMALLYLLHRFNIETVAVHCNYQLRGEASYKDQELVEKICMHWVIECVSLRFDTEKESQGNFQDWARTRRYQAFEDLKKQFSSVLILTAHHQDDQLETIFQKLLRGAGLNAWQGMEIIDGDLFRPLLNLSKSEIIQFVEQFNVPYRIDRTNEESTYARNFIRNHWFPDLNRLFPGWKSNVENLTDRAEEFELLTDKVLTDISISADRINRNEFLRLDPKIRPPILLKFLKKQIENVEISQGFLENINKIDRLQTGGKLQISQFYYLFRDRDYFKISEEDGSHEFKRMIEKNQVRESIIIDNFKFSIQPVPDTFSNDVLHLDHETISYPLTLRYWEDGDTFQHLGMEGSQLISDHLTNRKISSSKKREALILESFDGNICAVIFPNYEDRTELGSISELCCCHSSTKESLTIRRLDKHGSLPT